MNKINTLCDRLRGFAIPLNNDKNKSEQDKMKYYSKTPIIQHEAADRIEFLENKVKQLEKHLDSYLGILT